MSLLIHLPLNGNLDNHGFAELSVYSGTPSYLDSGKIGGQALDLNSRIVFDCAALNGLQTFSVAFWVRIDDNENLSTNWNDVISLYNKKADGTGTGYFRAETCYNSTSRYAGVHWHDNSLNAFTTGKMPTHYENDRGVWHHCALVLDYPNGIYGYTDGVLVSSYTTDLQGGMLNGRWHLGETDNISGAINDVRIYDHALSTREVKELSKGLVLHYPLNDSSIEETTNLMTDEYCVDSLCYNATIHEYHYGTSSDIYRENGFFEGRNCTKVYMGTDGASAFPYVHFPMPTDPGETKTLSFDYYPTIQSNVKFYNLSADTSLVYEINGVKGTATNVVTLPVNLREWNHIVLIATNTGSARGGMGYMQIGTSSHTSSTSNYWLFANTQVEMKDHATLYTPFGTTRSETTVYDVSGYGNNGEACDIITSSSTPRHLISSAFNGTSSYIMVSDNNWCSQDMREFTINLWAYADDWTEQTDAHLFSCMENGGFATEATSLSGAYLRFPICKYTNQKKTGHSFSYHQRAIQLSVLSSGWHMFTFVYDSTGSRTYVDGAPHSQSEFVSYGVYYNTTARLYLGCEATNNAGNTSPYFNGKESDFRFYVTALSDSDILELYETSVSLSNTGVLFAREFMEV